MATTDLSRNEFDPTKHYTGVRMQQGRVLTDEDWNENGRIEDEDMRRSRVDIIGPFGSPDEGFDISPLSSYPSTNPMEPDFNIAAGTMYLGGLRLQLETAQTYQQQSDWIDTPASTDQDNLPLDQEVSLVYLEAWQQPVSAVEDNELFETALGGPDTTTRIRNMHRVRIVKTSDTACADAWSDFKTNIRTPQNPQNMPSGTISDSFELVPDARLTATFNDGTNTGGDLCSPSVAGGYLGAENQAIRVEIISFDPANGLQYIWGFDNASPLYRVTPQLVSGSTTQYDITMITPPKDTYHWPAENQVVEILPCGAQLTNTEYLADEQSGIFYKAISSYNPSTGLKTFRIDTGMSGAIPLPQPPPAAATASHIYMRIWNRGTDISDLSRVTITTGTGGTVPLLNTGIAVTFTGTQFNKGDHWIIAARPPQPGKLIPWKVMNTNIPPIGVRRFFAPLALIQWNVNSGNVTGATLLHDCRKTFRPLTDLDCCCCTFTVGDGVNSFGDYNSIDEALSNLPNDGGQICVLKGMHYVTTVIANKNNITISGCDAESILQPAVIGSMGTNGQLSPSSPFLFFIQNCQNIKIENLTMAALTTNAIFITSSSASTGVGNYTNQNNSQHIIIENNQIAACGYGIYAGNVAYTAPAGTNTVGSVAICPDMETISNMIIRRNHIAITNTSTGNDTSAIYSMADLVLIEENQITAAPAPPPSGTSGGGNAGQTGGINPCADASKILGNHDKLWEVLGGIFVISAVAGFRTAATYVSWGGIHIDSNSEFVTILRNRIIGGAMNGITLGGLAPDPVTNKGSGTLSFIAYTASLPAAASVPGFTYNIRVEDNYISNMGLSGIGPGAFMDATVTGGTSFLLTTMGIDIFRNKIHNCGLQIPVNPIDTAAIGGICLPGCEDAIIRENLIEDNGNSYYDATCGVFIGHAVQIEICENCIRNTKTLDAAPANILKGTRGGIVILLAEQSLDPNNEIYNNAAGFNSSPAIKVSGNLVDQPIGHALFLKGSGLMSIVNNQLSSRGVDPNDSTSSLASTVFIFNIGISKDFLIILIMLNYQASGAKQTIDPALLLALLATVPAVAVFLKKYDFFPGGRILFTNNQVTMDMRNNTNVAAISAQFIFSFDDIGYDSNQSECIGLNILGQDFNIVLFHTFMFGITMRCNNNRFTEGLTISLYSLVSLAIVNTTIGNQATHCLVAFGSYINTLANNAEIYNIKCADKKASLWSTSS